VASRVVTQLISDLSGDEIPDGKGETIEFAYRGTPYKIDLTNKEAAGFDKALAMYIEHATSVATRRSAAASRTGRPDAKTVRTWAKANGLSVPDRGRIPADIWVKFQTS
jgi:hypothetical protein